MNDMYLKKLSAEILALEKERKNIEAAAKILASAQEQNMLIHVFGTDCISSSLISDIFFRKGSLTNINPIYDPTLDPAHGAYRNAMCMELDGLAPCILDYYEYIQAGEPMIIAGVDSLMFRQALGWAKEKGLKTIAIIDKDSDCNADVVIGYGSEAVALSALLKTVTNEAANMISNPQEHTWNGDVDSDAEKINELLYRIRHL